MKKLLVALGTLCAAVLLLSACSTKNKEATKEAATRTYTLSAKEKIKVPAHPKRVVVLAGYTGDLLDLNVHLVGVDSYAKANKNFASKLKNVKVISEDNVEAIAALKPDLIIGYSTTKNADKIKKIAPTVLYTYGTFDYLKQHEEIGKLVNKEKAAKAFTTSFRKQMAATGKKIKAKIGTNATVSVIENFDKEIYVFGDHWGRGTEVLYQGMGLKMPGKVQKETAKLGYASISQEVLGDYVGDYLIVSKGTTTGTSFTDTDAYKNIPAVQKGHAFTSNAEEFYFNDPISLRYQLAFFKKEFLGES